MLSCSQSVVEVSVFSGRWHQKANVAERPSLPQKTKTKQTQSWFFQATEAPKNAWLKMADKTQLPFSVDVACLPLWGENKEAAQQA